MLNELSQVDWLVNISFIVEEQISMSENSSFTVFPKKEYGHIFF